MPAYSGIQYKVVVRPSLPGAGVELKPVTAREWESSIEQSIPGFSGQEILGRMRNLDVELFGTYPNLQKELESLDYTVRKFDARIPLSIYPSTTFSQRDCRQKLMDLLWQCLRDDGEDVEFALVAGTAAEWLLIGKLDREDFNPNLPIQPTLSAGGVAYPVIGYILYNDVTITATEKEIKKYLANEKEPYIIYKIADLSSRAETKRKEEEEKEKEKEEEIRMFKRGKRRRNKKDKNKGRGKRGEDNDREGGEDKDREGGEDKDREGGE